MEQQQQQDEPFDCPRLELTNVIGFNGQVQNGLQFHPDREHIIYPLGCAVVIESIRSKKHPDLLWGHTDYVTCIAVSNKDGDLIASGQRTHMGFKADIIVWDYRSRQQLCKLNLHKVNVQALAFSPNNLYLASLGGCDDGSVVVWNMDDRHMGQAICGDQAQVKSAGNTLCICFSKKWDNVFVTGGESTLRVWELDVENRKIRPAEVDMGQIKRRVECIVMDDDNHEAPAKEFFYCGTSTGDVLAINMKSRNFQFKAPLKNNFENGVTALTHVKRDLFLVGTGCGKLYELQFSLPDDNGQKAKNKQPKPVILGCWQDTSVKSNNEAAITSITLRGAGHQFYVGTRNGRMYSFLYEDKFKDCKLIKTCHSSRVNDVAFPCQTSDLIVTCQKEQIRIWDTKNMKELQRHVIPNLTCNSVALTEDGAFIISAWDDGIIRVFGFKGKSQDLTLMKTIANAHSKGVTAVACTRNQYPKGEWDFNIISGGGEGQVRIWNFRQRGSCEPCCTLLDTLKEHKGLVSDIKVTRKDDMCVSSSTDGTCIIWDLEKRRRRQTVFANTLFKCVTYNKFENQIITSGTDRKIAYWETYDAALTRELEGAKTEAVNAMDLSSDGDYFVSGGDDKLVKVWNYDRGEVVAVGTGHSGNITRVKLCPFMKSIVSVSEDGAILVWKFPELR